MAKSTVTSSTNETLNVLKEAAKPQTKAMPTLRGQVVSDMMPVPGESLVAGSSARKLVAKKDQLGKKKDLPDDAQDLRGEVADAPVENLPSDMLVAQSGSAAATVAEVAPLQTSDAVASGASSGLTSSVSSAVASVTSAFAGLSSAGQAAVVMGGFAVTAAVVNSSTKSSSTDGRSGRSGETNTQTVAIVQGVVVAGPVVSDNDLYINAYSTLDGRLVSSEPVRLQANGTFTMTVTGYVGPAVFVLATGNEGAPDYLDEALGEAVDLSGALAAVAVIREGTQALNVSPLSTLAALELRINLLGLTVDTETLSLLNNAQWTTDRAEAAQAVTQAVAKVATAFGLTVDEFNGAIAPAVAQDAQGQVQSAAANKYGLVLAALAGLDYNDNATVTEGLLNLSAQIQLVGGQAQITNAGQSMILRGADAASAVTGLSLQQVATVLSPNAASVASRLDLAAIDLSDATQLAQLSPAVAAFLTATQFSQLSADNLRVLASAGDGDVLAVVQSDALVAWQETNNDEALLDLIGDALGSLTGSQMTELIDAGVVTLTAQQVTVLSPSALASVSADLIAELSVDAVRGLSPSQLRALTAEQLQVMSSEQLAQLDGDQLAGLRASQVAALTVDQFGGLTSDQQAAIAESGGMRGISPAQLAAVHADVIELVPATRFVDLTGPQIEALSADQLSNLSAVQLARTGAGTVNAAYIDLVRHAISESDATESVNSWSGLNDIIQPTIEAIAAVVSVSAGQTPAVALTTEQLQLLGMDINAIPVLAGANAVALADSAIFAGAVLEGAQITNASTLTAAIEATENIFEAVYGDAVDLADVLTVADAAALGFATPDETTRVTQTVPLIDMAFDRVAGGDAVTSAQLVQAIELARAVHALVVEEDVTQLTAGQLAELGFAEAGVPAATAAQATAAVQAVLAAADVAPSTSQAYQAVFDVSAELYTDVASSTVQPLSQQALTALGMQVTGDNAAALGDFVAAAAQSLEINDVPALFEAAQALDDIYQFLNADGELPSATALAGLGLVDAEYAAVLRAGLVGSDAVQAAQTWTEFNAVLQTAADAVETVIAVSAGQTPAIALTTDQLALLGMDLTGFDVSTADARAEIVSLVTAMLSASGIDDAASLTSAIAATEHMLAVLLVDPDAELSQHFMQEDAEALGFAVQSSADFTNATLPLIETAFDLVIGDAEPTTDDFIEAFNLAQSIHALVVEEDSAAITSTQSALLGFSTGNSVATGEVVLAALQAVIDAQLTEPTTANAYLSVFEVAAELYVAVTAENASPLSEAALTTLGLEVSQSNPAPALGAFVVDAVQSLDISTVPALVTASPAIERLDVYLRTGQADTFLASDFVTLDLASTAPSAGNALTVAITTLESRWSNGMTLDGLMQAYADTTPPTVTVSAVSASLASGAATTVNFTLSEASTNFALSDVTFANGTLSNFAGSGTSYSATFTKGATGTGTVSVASGVFTDAAGNANQDGNESNNSVSIALASSSGGGGGATPQQVATFLSGLTDWFNAYTTWYAANPVMGPNTPPAPTAADGLFTNEIIQTIFPGAVDSVAGYSAMVRSAISSAVRVPGYNQVSFSAPTSAQLAQLFETGTPLLAAKLAIVDYWNGDSQTPPTIEQFNAVLATYPVMGGSPVTITQDNYDEMNGALRDFGQSPQYSSLIGPLATINVVYNIAQQVSAGTYTVPFNATVSSGGGGGGGGSSVLPEDAVMDYLDGTSQTQPTMSQLNTLFMRFNQGQSVVDSGNYTSMLMALQDFRDSPYGDDLIMTSMMSPTPMLDVTGLYRIFEQVDAGTYRGPFDIYGGGGGGSGGGQTDFTEPQLLSITSNLASGATLGRGETARITFTFDEPVTDFSLADINWTNGELTNLQVDPSSSGAVYTATFTPSADINRWAEINIYANGYINPPATITDTAGNDFSGYGRYEFRVNTEAPLTATVELIDGQNDPNAVRMVVTFSRVVWQTITLANPFVVTGGDGGWGYPVTWEQDRTAGNEPIKFVSRDIIMTRGATELGLTFTSDFISQSGIVSASQQFTLPVDVTAPTFTVTSDVTALGEGESGTLTFEFNEDVTMTLASLNSGLKPTGVGAYTAVRSISAREYEVDFTAQNDLTGIRTLNFDGASWGPKLGATDAAGNSAVMPYNAQGSFVTITFDTSTAYRAILAKFDAGQSVTADDYVTAFGSTFAVDAGIKNIYNWDINQSMVMNMGDYITSMDRTDWRKSDFQAAVKSYSDFHLNVSNGTGEVTVEDMLALQITGLADQSSVDGLITYLQNNNMGWNTDPWDTVDELQAFASLDITPPTPTLVSSAGTYQNNQTIDVSSNEAGFVYLVRQGTFFNINEWNTNPEMFNDNKINKVEILQPGTTYQLSLSGLIGGSYAIIGVDAEYNTSTVGTYDITIPAVTPTVSINPIYANNASYNGRPSISITTDVSGYAYLVRQGTVVTSERDLGYTMSSVQSGVNSWTLPFLSSDNLQEGTYVVYVKDAETGAISLASTNTVVVDNTAPTLTDSSSSVRELGMGQNYQARSSEEGYIYLVAQGGWSMPDLTSAQDSTNSYSRIRVTSADIGQVMDIPVDGLADGFYWVAAVDKAGNWSDYSSYGRTFKVDSTPPDAPQVLGTSLGENTEISITAPTYEGVVYVVNDQYVADIHSVADILALGSEFWNSVAVPAQNVRTVNVPGQGLVAGTYKAYYAEAAGNLSDPSGTNIIFDDTRPTVTYADDRIAGSFYNGSINAYRAADSFTFQASEAGWVHMVNASAQINERDDLYSQGVTRQSQQFTGVNTSVTFVVDRYNTPEGEYKLYIEDAGGNLSLMNTSTIVVDSTAPTQVGSYQIINGSSNFALASQNSLLEITSNEDGFVYVVKNGTGINGSATWPDIAYIENLGSDVWNVQAVSANTPAQLSMAGLIGDNYINEFYRVILADSVGNLTGSLGVFYLDTTASTPSLDAGFDVSLNQGASLTVRTTGSNSEERTVYLVDQNLAPNSLQDILAFADDKWNAGPTVGYALASVDTTGLAAGQYYIYAIDEAGNLSMPAGNIVTVL
jgi:Bacterial Ig-like domain